MNIEKLVRYIGEYNTVINMIIEYIEKSIFWKFFIKSPLSQFGIGNL
jgi:hypothetical protein